MRRFAVRSLFTSVVRGAGATGASLAVGAIALTLVGCTGATRAGGPKIDATPMAPVDESLDAGPVLGARTATGAKIWVRLDPARLDAEKPTVLRLELLGASEGSARTFDAEASIDGDGTAVFRLEGLKPGQSHRYRIARVENADATLAEGSFATPPARMTRARIAFGGGAGAEADAATDATLRAVEREHPDAFILVVDTPSAAAASLAAQRAHYRARSKSAAFAELAAEIPLYAIRCSAYPAKQAADAGLAEKSNSRRAFCEYHPNPGFGDGVDGIHTSFTLGSAEIFLLDGRALESADTSGAGDMQWRWLEESLSRSTALFKVVAIGSAWRDQDAARRGLQRLAEAVGRARASGVVLLSTDAARSRVVRHATADAAGYNLLEFVAGPLHGASASSAVEVVPGVLFDQSATQTFLILDIEEARADGPELRAVFVDAQGSVIHTHETDLSALAPAR
ncbi:MAG: hypothetical protein GC172_08715 [Phycisphaera sp.]|nr:hypothetical protein [Phycisphaera sp.]